MIIAIVNHKVQDYDRWLTVFEKHSTVRAKHGITNEQVLRNPKDPNDVTLTFHCRSEKDLWNFVNSSDLKQIMEQAGVIGQPTITPLNLMKAYATR